MLDLLLIFAGMFILILLNDWYYKWNAIRRCPRQIDTGTPADRQCIAGIMIYN